MTISPHWTGWDANAQRLVVTGGSNRLYLLRLDQATGSLAVDGGFRDSDGKAGFNFDDRE
jgi:hypothetical protein